MESGMNRTQRNYTLAYKLTVVAQVEGGELTWKEPAQHYGIQGPSTFLVLLSKLGHQLWCEMASLNCPSF
jgi:transposase